MIAYLLVAFAGFAIANGLILDWFPTVDKVTAGWIGAGIGAVLGFFWKYVLATAVLAGSAMFCWEVFVRP